MPYAGPNDPELPEYVLDLPDDRAERWVAVWNDSFARCIDDGGEESECEGVAFRNANGVVLNMQHIAANVGLEIREEVRDGREWLVAPVVAIREGVLNGELAPADEISENVGAWNGRPFVLGHPQDRGGRYVSANNPAILERLELGRIFNSEWSDELNGIRAEVWLDIAKARALGGLAAEVMKRLRSKTPLEVSTAYWRNVEETAGEFNGNAYDGIQRRIMPDHLAALPNEVGACSWEDGCGAPRVQSQQPKGAIMIVNIRDSARTPDYTGTTSSEWNAPAWEDYVTAFYRANPDAEQPEDTDTPDVENAPAALKSWAAGKSLLGDSEADDFQNLVFFPVVEPGSQELNERALRAVIGGRGAQADIPAAALESARRKAYQLLNDEFDAGLEFEPLSTRASNTENREEEMKLKELMTNILESGRTTFTEEDLEAFNADQLEAILATVESLPEPTVNCQHEDMAGNEDDEGDGEDALAEGGDSELSEWDAAVQELGGVNVVKGLLLEIATNGQQRKKRLVAELAANERCRFTEDQLQEFNTNQLEALRASLADADYSGLGMGLSTHAEEGEAELPMPSIWES